MRIINRVMSVPTGLVIAALAAALLIIPAQSVRADAGGTTLPPQQTTTSSKVTTFSQGASQVAQDSGASRNTNQAGRGEDTANNTGSSGTKDAVSSPVSPYVSPDVLTGNTAGKPFSIEGNGNLVDDAYDDDTKEFITVQTKNNQTFFVVIDRANTLNNVYMLSMIDEDDLQQFLSDEDADLTKIDDISDLAALEEEEPEPEEKEQPKGSGGMLYIFLIIAGAGILAGYYYIRIYKPRKEEQEADSEDMEGTELKEDYEDEEEYPDSEERDYSDY